MKELCFWSVANGKHAFMLQTLVNSYHSVGMEEDFHVFSDREIQGAINHPIESLDVGFFFFKFAFLYNVLKNFDYKYFAFLDADNFFVRRPRSVLSLMENSPIHSFLEHDCTQPAVHSSWHKCPLPKYVQLMRECGVTSPQIYNVNAGFFIVKREAIEVICSLAEDFWKHSFVNGYVFTEEPSLAYATQMLCQDPTQHLLRNHSDIWCNDWTGQYAGRLPDGKEWMYKDFLSEEKYLVNPAIIHAMKSKNAMIEAGKSSS